MPYSQSALLAVLFLVGLSFASAADPVKHQWCTYSTEYFNITTDLSEADAKPLVEFLQNFHLLVEGDFLPYLGRTQKPAGILIFRNRRDFTRTTRSGFYSGYTEPSLVQTRIVLGPNAGGRYLTSTSLHEYTHLLMRLRPFYFPLWFEEGYASYLSATLFAPDQTVLGGIPENRGPDIPRALTPGLKKIFETKTLDGLSKRSATRFYARAWLLTHYLSTGYVAGFPDHRLHLQRYLDLLNDGLSNSKAFERAFEMRYPTLEAELRRYSRLTSLPTRVLPYTASAHTSIRHCLSKEDISLQLAQAVTYRNPAYAEKLYRNLLLFDPHNLDAKTGLSTTLAEQKNVRQATLIAWEAYNTGLRRELTAVQLANMLIRSCRTEEPELCASRWPQATKLYKEAIRLDPGRLDAVYGTGIGRLYRGLPGEALNYFRVAYLHAPWSPILNYYLGESYARIGKYSKARVHLERASNWAAGNYIKQAAQLALADLP